MQRGNLVRLRGKWSRKLARGTKSNILLPSSILDFSIRRKKKIPSILSLRVLSRRHQSVVYQPFCSRSPMGGRCGKDVRSDDDESHHKMDFDGGNVQIVTSKEDWDVKISEAKQGGKIVVVNFSASWCGPCRIMAPVYAEFSKKYPALSYLTVDVDALSEFSSSWDIRATPTFFFLKDGQQLDKLVGANKLDLEKKIIEYSDSLIQCKG